MRVSELAQELNTSSEVVLAKLKALKLKASGTTQELNKAVAVFVRSEIMKDLRKPAAPAKEEGRISKKDVEDAEKKIKAAKAKEEKAEEEKSKTAKAKKGTEKPAAKAEKAEDPAEKKKTTKSKTKSVEPVPVAAEVKTEKPKVSEEPFIALKPLPKKKKRITSRDGDFGREGGHDLSAAHVPGAAAESGAASPRPAESVAQPAVQLKELQVELPIAVKDLAVRLQLKTSVLLKTLMQMGVFANINQYLEEDIVRRIAQEFGFELTKVKTQEEKLIQEHREEEEDPSLMTPRAPVVTFMGHVDHGKTSLLDRIRKSRVADQEHGGITQHIGAYSVKVPKGRIAFFDTPGHEAFTAMRARGAHITDIVVLVVAADEGVMPQTEEAINHARAADVPIVVALNKIDRQDANIDRVKKQLADHDLNPEDWGGKTVVVGVSATTGEGIDQLLEMILLEAEMLELKANSQKRASGIIVDANLSRGRGAVATLIVQSGTLKLNDIVVVGPNYGKVKAMFDDRERPVREAGPSTPVEILGLPAVPEAGETFYVAEDERKARDITSVRQEQVRSDRFKAAGQKITLEDLYQQIKDGKIVELNVILKSDVQGSLEALQDSLAKIPNDEVKLKFIHKGVGDINTSDVILAVASNAIIIGFQVGVEPRAEKELEKTPVDVRHYRIIYDAVNDLRKALEGLLEPKTRRKFLGRVEIRQMFKLSRSGVVAGSYVTKGKVNRKAHIEVVRNGEVVHSGTLSSLKRFKDDVREVTEGFECGLTVQGFNEQLQAGDIIEAFELETIARTL